MSDPGELAARVLVYSWMLLLVLGAGALAVTAPPAAIIPAFGVWKLYKFLAHKPDLVT